MGKSDEKEKASASSANASSPTHLKQNLKLHEQISNIKATELASGNVCEKCYRSGDEPYELQAFKTGSNPPMILRPSCKILPIAETLTFFDLVDKLVEASLKFRMCARDIQFLLLYLKSLCSEGGNVYLFNVRYTKLDHWAELLEADKSLISKIIDRLVDAGILRKLKRDRYHLNLVLTEPFVSWMSGGELPGRVIKTRGGKPRSKKQIKNKFSELSSGTTLNDSELSSSTTLGSSVFRTEAVDIGDNSGPELSWGTTESCHGEQPRVVVGNNSELSCGTTLHYIEDSSSVIPLQLPLPDSSPPQANSVDNFFGDFDSLSEEPESAQIEYLAKVIEQFEKDCPLEPEIEGTKLRGYLELILKQAGSVKIVHEFVGDLPKLPLKSSTGKFTQSVLGILFTTWNCDRKRRIELEQENAS